MKKLKIAVLGATGAVGREMMKILDEYDIPIAELRLLASARSAGNVLNFKGQDIVLQEATENSFEGLDFALTALFVTVFTDQWMKTGRHLPALIGAGASLVCLRVFGPDTFLIPAMLLITLLLLVLPHGRMTDAEGGDGHD